MYKKLIRLITTIIFILLFFVPISAKAVAFTDNETVDKQKIWTIRFNKEILYNDLTKQNIKVIDSKGNIVSNTTSLGGDNKSIIVNPPIEGYVEGENYKIVINSSVKSKEQKSLKENVVFNFNIKKTKLSAKDINNNYSDAVVYLEAQDINHKVIASGSGFIVNSTGTVVTNFHVIKGCAFASVTLKNGTKYNVKSVLNYSKEQDIAILQLSNTHNLNTVKLGDSNNVEVGDDVVAIGSPIGYENTLSAGIISGINRKSERGNDLQTTASITHGSSGGALFDVYGNVIGITYAGYDSAGDIGFVIPINEVKPFLNSSNEKTLTEINNIQIGTVKFFPESPNVPMPQNSSYYKTTLSSDEKSIVYYFSLQSLPDNFSESYFTLLKNNGWVLYKEDTDSDGNPVTSFSKGNDLILLGLVGTDFVVIGPNYNYVDTVKFFPQLSDAPMPQNVSYYKSSLSSDGTTIFYHYSAKSMPDNFFSDYSSLLKDNGWVFYKSETDSRGNPMTGYTKGSHLIMMTWVGTDFVIVGKIH